MYEALLAGHILLAAMWAGGGVTLHILGRRAVKAGPGPAVAFAEDFGFFGSRVYGPMAILLLLLGILLVGEAGYEHSQLWISLAYVGWLIAAVLGAVVYPRLVMRVGQAVASGGGDAARGVAGVRHVLTLNTVEITILLLIIVDMAVKPGVG